MNSLYLQCERAGGSWEVGRSECTLHRWPRPLAMGDCSRPYQ